METKQTEQLYFTKLDSVRVSWAFSVPSAFSGEMRSVQQLVTTTMLKD